MAGSVTYENDFIVDGNANTRLSANFKVKEFQDKNGKLHVHRELVAGLQILRNRFGSGIDIISIKAPASMDQGPTGLGVTIKSEDMLMLEKAAKKLKTEGYFSRVEPHSSGLYLEIPVPDAMPAINAETAFDCGMQVTAAFETSGDPYQQVTGNFDGAGLSYGPFNVTCCRGPCRNFSAVFVVRMKANSRTASITMKRTTKLSGRCWMARVKRRSSGGMP